MKTCAFTGHRPKSVDMYAAEIVLALKEKYPQITLECAIPYERQAVWYARETGKPVWIIRPDTLEVQKKKPLCQGRGVSFFVGAVTPLSPLRGQLPLGGAGVQLFSSWVRVWKYFR